MNNIKGILTIWQVLFLVMLSTNVVAQNLSDTELFEQGRQAYADGRYVEAAMKLYAYKLRNPIALQTDDNHKKQVDDAINFCVEQPVSQAKKLQMDLDSCRTNYSNLAAQCNQQVVASTTSYMIHRPKLDKLGASVAAPKFYPLICRGGGGVSLTWSNQKQKGVQNALLLSFKKGNVGVGNNKSLLNPGYCSWKDRAMSQSEPSVLCYGLGKQGFAVSWLLDKQQAGVKARNLPKEFGNLSDADKYAEFNVYNNKEGCLVVMPKFAFKAMHPLAPPLHMQ